MIKKNLELNASDFDRLSNATGNVFKSVVAVAKRSKRLKEGQSVSFCGELEELNIKEGGDNNLVDSDIQELVSKRYELVPKPSVTALEELLSGKLEISYEEENIFSL